jgi:hypothetical protein
MRMLSSKVLYENKNLMAQTLRPRTINISPVSTRSGFSDLASVSRHNEQARVP